MKKYLYASLFAIVFSIFIIIIFNIEISHNEIDEEAKMNSYLNEKFENSTYLFYGSSEHFKFTTGKALYSNFENAVLIDDFIQTKTIEDLAYEKIIIYFDDMEWRSIENKQNLNILNKKISVFNFYESNAGCFDLEHCEFSSFDLTNVKNFKDLIKIEIQYCTDDNKCDSEFFDIFFK